MRISSVVVLLLGCWNLSPVGSSHITTRPHNTSQVSSSHITTNPQNTSQVSSSHITTNPQNTSQVSSSHITSNPQNASPVSSRHITTNPQNTSQVSSSHITTNPQNTGQVSSSHITTNPQNTSQVSSSHITTNQKNKVDQSRVDIEGCPETCVCEVGFESLTITNCSTDPIAELPVVFDLYQDITDLSVTRSHLSGIPCIITKLTELLNLNLKGNEIREVPWDCLKRLPELFSLDLSSNRIETIINGSLYDFKSIYIIDLNSNHISTIEGDVFLQSNRFPPELCVNLSRNQLKSLDSWPVHLGLTDAIFDLQDNMISNLTNTVGAPNIPCTYIKSSSIDLSGNDIKHFMDILKNWNVTYTTGKMLDDCTSTIFLLENPLTCDCVDYDIYAHIHGSKLALYQNLTCHLPVNLRGKSPASIPLDQFICDVNEDCPSSCKCSNIPFHRNLDVSCTNYKDTELPKTVPIVSDEGFSYFLNFTNSHLKDLDFRPYFLNTSIAIFSNSQIREVSRDVLFAMSTVSKLHLDNNKLKRLPNNLSSIRFGANSELYLGGNQWVCDCEALETRNWIGTHTKIIKDSGRIICSSPSQMAGKTMITVDQVLFCPPESMTKYIIIGIVAAVVALFVSLSVCFVSKKRTWIYRRTGWHPLNRDEGADEGKEFDVFVSYADEDEEYVGEYLIPELQNHGFKVCYHRVNFHAGKPITLNIFECIDGSKRTLVFFSNSFLQSNFCMGEFSVALELDLKQDTNRLITIKDTDLDIENLDVTSRSYFKRSTYIEREAANFWENLLYSLPIERMGDPVEPPQPINDEE